MKTIIEEKEFTYITLKSKFIGIIKKVNDIEEINDYLNTYQKKYKDATHLCYAYVLPTSQKYSDDNEPSGTAGMPILNVLKMNDLNYCLAIVIRYFGGIKLGSGRLVRAYSHTISEIVKDNTKICEEGYLIRITEDYKKLEEINYLLGDNIINKNFNEKIIIEAKVNKKMLENLSNIHYQIIKEVIL